MEELPGTNVEDTIAEDAVQEILRARAKILARRESVTDDRHQYVDALFFTLADETYALPIEFLEDVFVLRGVTPVPCTPSFVMGIVAIRGQIFSILNLKALFEIPHETNDTLKYVLLMVMDGMVFGVAVESIIGVQSLAIDTLQPPLSTLSGFKADYVQGITEDTVIVLNARRILSDNRIIVEEVVQ